LGMNYALPSRGKVKLMRVIKMQNSWGLLCGFVFLLHQMGDFFHIPV
jgi:hypothetical protein